MQRKKPYTAELFTSISRLLFKKGLEAPILEDGTELNSKDVISSELGTEHAKIMELIGNLDPKEKEKLSQELFELMSLGDSLTQLRQGKLARSKELEAILASLDQNKNN